MKYGLLNNFKKMKKAIVTGASSGLGKYISIQLSQQKIRVIGIARSRTKLEKLKKYIGKKYFDYVNFDLKKIDQIENIFKSIIKKEKFIEILINNAGIYKQSNLQNINISEINDMIDTNLKAPMILTKILSNNMKKNKKGCIINISSIAGKVPIKEASVYCGTKYGLAGCGRSLNKELKNSGIGVCTIFPGGINTPLWKNTKYKPGKLKDSLKPQDIFKIIDLMLQFGKRVNFNEAVITPTIENF